ncbi:putative bifunctional diguanylate cyclase/phosphodiesterase [Rhizobium helianthi]|uniref:Bifunctional diguanylate cyclase/phosphodiesterase n=1 Tax=Rhizobium helianthi TaxID=1132695 RepID=A0ABW4M792_9HYPH
MTRSVESRFIAIISGALLIVVVPLFTLFLALSSRQAAESLHDHMQVLIGANSQALSKPLWDLDIESIRQVTESMVTESAIRVVRVTDTLGKFDVTESNLRESGENLERLTRPIVYRGPDGIQTIGTLTLHYSKVGLFAALNRMEITLISIFAVAIFVVFTAAIVGNRLMVIRPLLRLTAAVEATRRLGSRHHVNWHSNDEIGRLAKSFNEMQTQLDREERELKRAHQQTSEIYNLTPAMLFSLDSDDLIWAVSDYWLLATGYSRRTVLGRPFVELIVEEDRPLYLNRKAQSGYEGAARGVTVRFECANGRIIDVLIMETLLKTSSAELPTSLSVMTDVTELKQSELRNHQQAITDHLTGLLNRQGFEAVLDQKIAQADKEKTQVACLFIDLDRFKAINDTLGHAAGDTVLRQFVERIGPLIAQEDCASRLGGDEFALLITGAQAEERAGAICEKIVNVFEAAFEVEGSNVRLSASIGLASYPRHASSAAQLLQRSDMAMYARKRDGKNGASVYDDAISDRTRQRAEIEKDISEALENSWFEAHFQPIVDVETQETRGYEALMRLRHGKKGLLAPANFIAVAEETGTIGLIGNQILDDALKNLASISKLPGMQNAYVAVNFSPLQFEPGLPIRIASQASRFGIRPSQLVVEITEAVLLHDNPEVRKILDQIHEFGCRIALDDFGTGYSSLSYLSRVPVDIIKIDQSFVRSIGTDQAIVAQKNRMLMESINAIAHKMNCTVIAEGVETTEQFKLLQSLGVDCAQGYLFSKPRFVPDLIREMTTSRKPAEIRIA